MTPGKCLKNRISRHDDFIVEAARGDDQQKSAHEAKNEAVGPEMSPTGATKDDAARDVDEICGGNEVAEEEEKFGHGLAREDVTREEDAGKDSEESELHGVRLGSGLTGNEDAQRERNKNVRQGKACEEQHAPMNGNKKQKAHSEENHGEFKKADAEIRKQFAEKQAHRTHWGDEKLLQGATLFFPDDGEGGEERGHIEE